MLLLLLQHLLAGSNMRRTINGSLELCCSMKGVVGSKEEEEVAEEVEGQAEKREEELVAEEGEEETKKEAEVVEEEEEEMVTLELTKSVQRLFK